MKSKASPEDPAYPEKYPHRYKPTSCACCAKCWLDLKTGHCLYGGPFTGYVKVEPK